MNAAQLLQHYERIADAPDAIARLRHLVLALAIRGKLNDRALDTEPKLGRGPRNSSSQTSRTDVVKSDLPPFDIPISWQWVRIGDHLELINGAAFKPTDWRTSGVPIVRIQILNRPEAPFNYCDPKAVRDRFFIADSAFLISWSGTPGTSFGAFIWNRSKAVLNQHIFRCDFHTNLFDKTFLRIAINGRLDEIIEKAHGGVGLQHITKGKLEAMLLPLPPLVEQRHIVAKVDELMALCDRLEAARTEREANRDRLSGATLSRLNTPDADTKVFALHARFALGNLDALTTRSDQIKQLRKTILSLAVRGKLVPQDPNDEPASELLKRAAIDIAAFAKQHRVASRVFVAFGVVRF